MNSIIIIDRNKATLKLIERSLEDHYKVHKTDSSLDAFDLILNLLPNLIILDINMDIIDGYELCSKIKETNSIKNIPLIFTSQKKSNASRLLAYRLGAIHYLQKPLDPQELSLICQSVIRQYQSTSQDTNILELENFHLDSKNRYCWDDHFDSHLTHSECVLLEALMKYPGETISREILANKLSQYKDRISYRTVDAHICSIRKKIKNFNISIISIYNIGYRLQEKICPKPLMRNSSPPF